MLDAETGEAIDWYQFEKFDSTEKIIEGKWLF
jgi:hypothetical protein